ncbi:mitochondrial ribosomal protein subunit L20-domain-containing protein [Spinellus fusiger]|nr:mitochondrial ribosomal protein subunit L20-domain-containing protein [Spinellus fusiger]
MFRCSIARAGVRTYATKSKTINLKMKPHVPIQEETLADGSLFLTRQPPVTPQVQSTAPALKPRVEQPMLPESALDEMRQLRNSDPIHWTRKRLAEKFGCSELFVGMTAPTTKVIGQQQHQEPKGKDGYRKLLIKQNREKRKALW